MSAETWRVEARTHGYATDFALYIDRLSRDIAQETAEVLQHLHPAWQMRLVNDTSGELVHLGRDGKPVTA